MRFNVLDGAHQFRAIRSLMKKPSAPLLNSETRINVEVVRVKSSFVQRSLDAAAENAKNTREFENKTFNDDLWAMIGIEAKAFRRLISFSTAVAEEPDAEVVHVPDPAAATRRKGSSRKVIPLLSLPKLPEEGAGFIETYVSSMASHMIFKISGMKPYRRNFHHEANKDRELLYPSVLHSLLDDSHCMSPSSVLSVKNEGVKCK
jgi:hypothetical protein